MSSKVSDSAICNAVLSGRPLEFKVVKNKSGTPKSVRVMVEGDADFEKYPTTRNRVAKVMISQMKSRVEDTFDNRIAILEKLKEQLQVVPAEKSKLLSVRQFFGNLFYNRDKKLQQAIDGLKEAREKQKMDVGRFAKSWWEKAIKQRVRDYNEMQKAKFNEKTVGKLQNQLKQALGGKFTIQLTPEQLDLEIRGGAQLAIKLFKKLNEEDQQAALKLFLPPKEVPKKKVIEEVEEERTVEKMPLATTGLSPEEQAEFKALWKEVAPDEDLPTTKSEFERAVLKAKKKVLKHNKGEAKNLIKLLRKILGKDAVKKLEDEAHTAYAIAKWKK